MISKRDSKVLIRLDEITRSSESLCGVAVNQRKLQLSLRRGMNGKRSENQ
jgi:hypothetical protein